MNQIRTLYQQGDTIIAPASLVGGGVAVIRASGPACNAIVQALGVNPHTLTSRMATLKTLRDNEDAIDHVLLLTFPSPHSFTGEDVLEIHTHGSPAVVEKIIDLAIKTVPQVRLAEAGEFSRRAVSNGKMDLTQAEGLADLIAANTEAQRKQALTQMEGALGERFENWRKNLIHLLAQVEAGIDFPDEELEILADPALTKALLGLIEDLNLALAERAGERIRTGIRLAIVGEPNAGKSTLLNALAQADIAITSPIAGTTRDIVTKQLNIGGYPVEIADTAGLRDETSDVIEAEGIKRARKQAAQADIIIWVHPLHKAPPRLLPGATAKTLSHYPWLTLGLPASYPSLVLLSKADQNPTSNPPKYIEIEDKKVPTLPIDLTDSTAHPRLLAALIPLLQNVAENSQKSALLTRARHRKAVEETLAALARAHVLITKSQSNTMGSMSELVAEELRQAAENLGQVTGRTDTESVLDEVFSTFCIGK
ncbi:MAG: tRNA uridine-5-carboxymethylaminomethyl(34) synthesis GTPase MnmE [Alphaproteobacteria bacterium CG_4_10_14_0_8_um_filter_53_9]|nr:MAG: tRNA uridine-5-carboxymethylaminomethyl(34) synthesis GTPase MnmE [Alphaproteobacteria bacterium CG_4_10_14_0_8_um_filter_53_9]